MVFGSPHGVCDPLSFLTMTAYLSLIESCAGLRDWWANSDAFLAWPLPGISINQLGWISSVVVNGPMRILNYVHLQKMSVKSLNFKRKSFVTNSLVVLPISSVFAVHEQGLSPSPGVSHHMPDCDPCWRCLNLIHVLSYPVRVSVIFNIATVY